jgi:hypothetical protein
MGEKFAHGATDQVLMSPIHAVLRRVHHLRQNNAPADTHLHTVFLPAGTTTQVTSNRLSAMLRRTCRLMPELPSEISARALRAGGAMALLCARVDPPIVQLIGRCFGTSTSKLPTCMTLPAGCYLAATSSSYLTKRSPLKQLPFCPAAPQQRAPNRFPTHSSPMSFHHPRPVLLASDLARTTRWRQFPVWRATGVSSKLGLPTTPLTYTSTPTYLSNKSIKDSNESELCKLTDSGSLSRRSQRCQIQHGTKNPLYALYLRVEPIPRYSNPDCSCLLIMTMNTENTCFGK